MNETFSFAIPPCELATLVGSEKGPHTLQVIFSGVMFELGQYVFTGAAVDGVNDSCVVTLKKQVIEEPKA